MMSLKGWFVGAAVLAFVAGGGSFLVADRLLEPGSHRPAEADAEGYLRVFEQQIGIENDGQRRALSSAYDRYWRDLHDLTRKIAAEHREELEQIDRDFRQQVLQQLNETQRRKWLELTRGGGGTAGPADTDAGE